MKRGTKIALMTGASLCIVGTALFSVGVAAGGRDYVGRTDLNSLKNTEEYAELEEAGYTNQLTEDNIKLDEFQKVQIDCKNLDVSIVPSDEEYSYLSYEVEPTAKGNNPLSYDVTDGMLTLKETNGSEAGAYIHIDIDFVGALLGTSDWDYDAYHKNEVTLYLAKNAGIDSSDITMGDGDLTIEGMDSDEVNWTLAYGDLTLSDCTLKNGTVTLHDGDLVLNHSSWSDAELMLDYGDLSGSETAWEDVSVQLMDGDAGLDKLSIAGNINLVSSYGDISIRLALNDEQNPTFKQAESPDEDGEITGYRMGLEDGTELTVECEDGEVLVK